MIRQCAETRICDLIVMRHWPGTDDPIEVSEAYIPGTVVPKQFTADSLEQWVEALSLAITERELIVRKGWVPDA